jgi:tetratricopeptide (TPR) repeat protein
MPAARCQDPNAQDPRTLCNMGVRARKDGNHKQALAYFELAAAADPRHLRARLEAARELAALSRVDEAASMLRRVLADDPRHVQALFELAALLRTQSRFEEAEELLQQAVALSPDDVRIRLNLARLLRRRGHRDQKRAHGAHTQGCPHGSSGPVRHGHLRQAGTSDRAPGPVASQVRRRRERASCAGAGT